MKKRIAAIGLLICVMLMCAHGAFAEQRYGHHYFEYYVKDSGIQICGYLGDEEVVTVPNFISGLPVYAIVDGAFADCPSVKVLNLPDTIMEIEEGAISSSISVVYMGNSYNNQSGSQDQTAIADNPDEETDPPQPGTAAEPGTAPEGQDNAPSSPDEVRTDGAEETGKESGSNSKTEENRSDRPSNGSDAGKEQDNSVPDASSNEDNDAAVTYSDGNEKSGADPLKKAVTALCIIAVLAILWFILLRRRREEEE